MVLPNNQSLHETTRLTSKGIEAKGSFFELSSNKSGFKDLLSSSDPHQLTFYRHVISDEFNFHNSCDCGIEKNVRMSYNVRPSCPIAPFAAEYDRNSCPH